MVSYAFESFNLKPGEALIARVSDVFSSAILYNPPKLNDGIKDALEALEKDFKLAIVSDTGFSPGKTLRSLLNTESILHFFSAFSFSDETGFSKPSPESFNFAIRQFDGGNITPQECIHIGDNARTDISGAKQLGMRAIHYTGDESNLLVNREQMSEIPSDFTSTSWYDIVNWISKNA